MGPASRLVAAALICAITVEVRAQTPGDSVPPGDSVRPGDSVGPGDSVLAADSVRPGGSAQTPGDSVLHADSVRSGDRVLAGSNLPEDGSLVLGDSLSRGDSLLRGDSLSRGGSILPGDGLLQVDDRLHVYLENLHTLGRLPNGHVAHKPLSYYEAAAYLDSLPPRPRPRAVGPFFGNGVDVWSIERDDYAIQLNPLLYAAYGRGGGRPTWRNTRGVRASGRVGAHVFFEARLEETQERPALTRFDRITAPRLPFVREYADSTGYDYQIGTGIAAFRSKHFEIRFGRDRNHWGYGEGSLSLSDFAPIYDHLQVRTTFWRLQYVNLFAAFSDVPPFGPTVPNTLYPRKYGAFHRLSVNVTERINLSVFESVIFGPDTTSGRGDGFDPAYLNPVIFYRTVEADRGSPDNILVGAGGSWIAVDGLRFYGEIILDEFIVSEVFTDSWTNKTGYLAGLHVVPMENLSFRAEYARLRPFLYTHRSTATAYLHYLDGLGHPAGPNAVDAAFFVDWQPSARWHAALNLSYTVSGRSSAGENVGDDLRHSFDTRTSDTAEMLAGVRRKHLLFEGYAGYELLPRLYLEVALRSERIDDAFDGVTSQLEPFAALRWGLPFESIRY